MHSLLEGGTDREAVLARFVSELSIQDEHMLQQLLFGNGSRAEDDRPGGRS
jgi:hypothetical protein